MKLKLLNANLLIILAIFSYSCNNNNQQLRGVTKEERALIARDSANYTYIKWLETSINFGTINSGEKVKLIYRFKNVGEKPLFVISVSEACKCALTEYNTDPIQPGKQGTIAVTFDSKTQAEAIRKSLVVETNTFDNRYQHLIFTGHVRDCCGGNAEEDNQDDNPYVVY